MLTQPPRVGIRQAPAQLSGEDPQPLAHDDRAEQEKTFFPYFEKSNSDHIFYVFGGRGSS